MVDLPVIGLKFSSYQLEVKNHFTEGHGSKKMHMLTERGGGGGGGGIVWKIHGLEPFLPQSVSVVVLWNVHCVRGVAMPSPPLGIISPSWISITCRPKINKLFPLSEAIPDNGPRVGDKVTC